MTKIDQDENELSSRVSQRGIYLLPNLLTTAALFSGFYAIVAAMKGFYETAAIAIFVGIIADGLDGRVARLTGTQSAFGAQYDSLSDMAAFGIAPALVMYTWTLSSLGKIGWLASFIFAAATALRLARFTSQVHTKQQDKRYFQGLPSPSGAGVLASIVWLGASYGIDGDVIAIPSAILTVLVGALMVSTIRYYSFKNIDFKGRVPFVTIVLTVFLIAALALQPAEMLFILLTAYVLSGPAMTLWQLQKMRKHRSADHAQKNKK